MYWFTLAAVRIGRGVNSPIQREGQPPQMWQYLPFQMPTLHNNSLLCTLYTHSSTLRNTKQTLASLPSNATCAIFQCVSFWVASTCAFCPIAVPSCEQEY